MHISSIPGMNPKELLCICGSGVTADDEKLKCEAIGRLLLLLYDEGLDDLYSRLLSQYERMVEREE